MFYIAGVLIICLIIYYFVAKNLNPVPYYPTNPKDIKRIIKLLELKNDQTVIDLGAGNGEIIFEAANTANEKELNTRFVAIDINVFLVLIMIIRSLFHKNRSKIRFVWKDIFKYDFRQIIGKNQTTTIYVYFAPWINDALGTLLKKLPRPVKVVSYYYPINNLHLTKKVKGEHDVFLYYIR